MYIIHTYLPTFRGYEKFKSFILFLKITKKNNKKRKTNLNQSLLLCLKSFENFSQNMNWEKVFFHQKNQRKNIEKTQKVIV